MLNGYYYNRLSDKEKEKYTNLLGALLGYKEKVEIGSLLEEITMQAILAEHPELFYCYLREIDYYKGPFQILAVPKFYLSKADSKIVSERIKQISNSIPSSSAEETIRAIHNYIVKNVKYDYISGRSNKYEHEGHTVIGPLMNGKGVCEGLALTFKWLLDLKGIDNTTVTGKYGEAGKDIYHMWNVVSIQGRNYYIDITQDIASTNDAWGKPSYLFYLLTEAEIRQDHAFEENFGCNNTVDNPFYKAGRVFSNVLALEQFARNIPASQRLINFMYTGPESQETITNIVQRAIPKNPLYPRMSTTKNYGRYYFYKEV